MVASSPEIARQTDQSTDSTLLVSSQYVVGFITSNHFSLLIMTDRTTVTSFLHVRLRHRHCR